MIGVAIFAGGMVTLALASGVVKKQLEPRARIGFFKSLGRLFGYVSAGALVLLAGSGFYMADRRLGSLSQLSDTEWGRILTEKLGLVLVLVILVLLHSFFIGPSLGELRERLLEDPDNRELESKLRKKRILSGATNGLMLLVALAVIVMGARLATS